MDASVLSLRGCDAAQNAHNSLQGSGLLSFSAKMADRRRRRRRASQDSEEEDESASGSETERPSSPGGKARVRDPEPVEVPTVRVVVKRDDESECVSAPPPSWWERS